MWSAKSYLVPFAALAVFRTYKQKKVREKPQSTCLAINNKVEVTIIFIGLGVLTVGGFGSKLAFELTATIICGLCLIACLKKRKAGVAATVLALTLIGIFQPCSYRLYGYWVCILILSTIPRQLAIIPITSWGYEFISDSAITMLVLPLGMALCATVIPAKILNKLLIVALMLLLGATILHMLSSQAKFKVEENSTFSAEYKIGTIIKSTFPESFTANEAQSIRSIIHGTTTAPNVAGIVIAEHDTPAALTYGRITEKNFQQPTPWEENEFIGNQYWKFAICKDKCLVSNLGASLTQRGSILLAQPRLNILKPTILATKYNNITYCADSDYWSNRLCNYQQNLLGTILGVKRYILHPLLANALFALVAILVLTFNRIYLLSLGACIPLMFNAHQPGNIRMVGSNHNPHDPTRIWAVARILQDTKINAQLGTSGAKVLLVEAGKQVTAANEKLIIAEPAACIKLGTHFIKILEEPLGTINNIEDARNIELDGKLVGASTEVNGTTIVGTGSPTLTPLYLWHILQE